MNRFYGVLAIIISLFLLFSVVGAQDLQQRKSDMQAEVNKLEAKIELLTDLANNLTRNKFSLEDIVARYKKEMAAIDKKIAEQVKTQEPKPEKPK